MKLKFVNLHKDLCDYRLEHGEFKNQIKKGGHQVSF